MLWKLLLKHLISYLCITFLPLCGYCASLASSPTDDAKGEANSLPRREGMQKYTPSLLEGK
jgi:hypothetical protein